MKKFGAQSDRWFRFTALVLKFSWEKELRNTQINHSPRQSGRFSTITGKLLERLAGASCVSERPYQSLVLSSMRGSIR